MWNLDLNILSGVAIMRTTSQKIIGGVIESSM